MGKKIFISDFVGLSKKADLHKEKDKSVINGTLGSFKTDKGKLFTFGTLGKIIRHELVDDEIFDYPNIDGGPEYHRNILNYTFQKHYSWIQKKFFPIVCAAVGGTGSIHLTLKCCIDKKNSRVLIAKPCWSTYIQIVETASGVPEYFHLFDKNLDFNIQDFIAQSEKILKKQNKLITIINTPANNPTGYSLTKNDWNKLTTYLNSLKKRNKTVDLIVDPAYFDYERCDYKNIRDFFLYLKDTDKHINNLICFAGSKSFASYGLRVGAMIALSNTKEQQKFYELKAKSIARSTWSEAPLIGISLTNKIFSNKKNTQGFFSDLQSSAKLLHYRVAIFLKEAKACGLITNKYHGGYFISIPYHNPEILNQKLVENKIYTIPFYKCVRLAISNIPTKEVKGLAKRIHKVLTTLK